MAALSWSMVPEGLQRTAMTADTWPDAHPCRRTLQVNEAGLRSPQPE